MLNLTFAPSADVLAPLAKERILGAWRDPFDPPTVVVPNPAVGKWLSIWLAEDPSVGCVANARMPTLERFLWDALGPAPDTQMIDAGHLSQIICALLDEGLLGDDVYKPLRDYLRVDANHIINNNAINLGIDPIKRVQLSVRIARQFLEYEYNRPSVWSDEAARWGRHGIDARWLLGKEYFEGREHEAWQMDLYRRTFERLSKSVSPRYATLPHLYRQKREVCAKERRPWCDVGSNHQIILFGVSKISHFHRNTLVEISQSAGIDMHVLLTNPCAEFWEDVDTSRRTRAPRRRWSSDSPSEIAGITPVKPEDYDKGKLDRFADDEDHALLKLWGAAGKENIFLWCPQAQWNFEYHGEIDGDSGTNTTLLHAIQRSLLSRNNKLDFINTSSQKGKDRSLQILACPDLSREVEEARELILDMANDNAIRSFSDIAVYMPDPNKYLPYIQRVFGAYPHSHPEYIPFTVIGASGGSSLTARALSALLSIAGGEFNRAMIFELLDNPIVRESCGFSHSDMERWEEWAEGYGMFRGYNAEQRCLMGDKGGAVVNDHTFDHGMWLVEDSAEMIKDGAKQSAELFRSLLEKLSDLSKFFSGNNGSLNIRDAAEYIRKAVWLWLGHIGGGSVDAAAETRVRREALNGLAQIELQHTCAGRVNMSKEEFLTLARDCVPGELTAPSAAWRGVTFAPLRASMVLPHRAIFAMGLGAAEFPGTNEAPSWDLLPSKRIVGDSDRVRDNRFAFLELLHAAKERLILSYKARDMQKDEELQPSSVVLELEEYLIGQGLVDSEVNSRKCSARREIPWVVHETLNKAMEAGRKHGSWDKEQRILAAESLKDRVEHRHNLAVNRRLSTNGDLPANIDSSAKTADLPALKKFLSNPLEYHLSMTLGIRDDDDAGDMTATDEPIDSGYNISKLRKKVWIDIISVIFKDTGTEPPPSDDIIIKSAFDAADKIVDDIYDDHIDSGQAPEGHICRMERKELKDWAMECVGASIKLRKVFPNHQFEEKRFSFLSCGDFTINVRHEFAIVPKDANNQNNKIGVIAFGKKVKPTDNLKLWLDGLTMWLNEMKEGGKRRHVVLIGLSYDDKHQVENLPMTVKVRKSDMTMDAGKLQDVEKWLTGILTQMLIDKRREHLPYDAINNIEELTTGSLKDYLLTKYTTYTDGFNLTDANAKPPEVDDELRELAESRYAPIINKWIHTEEQEMNNEQ
ncbi:MAG: exodeoxyribonuclease V subunit gamma [Chitinispirillales bacterium]|jgi:exodeoxyribonuclease V gamma subunit|nr:exodeoxyribonuclease V subunit gamma [Chitinispirillales bacterium]